MIFLLLLPCLVGAVVGAAIGALLGRSSLNPHVNAQPVILTGSLGGALGGALFWIFDIAVLVDYLKSFPAESVLPEAAMSEPNDSDKPAADNNHAALQAIREALRGLQYGAVTATVQDGLVIQVERTEKWRLQRNSRKTSI